MANGIETAQTILTQLIITDKIYPGLPKNSGDRVPTDAAVRSIRRCLEDAGADFSLLDPSGKKSAAEMEKELNHLQVSEARRIYNELLAGSNAGYGRASSAGSALIANIQQAGAQLSDLDASGKKSEAEVYKEINKAVFDIDIKDARESVRKVLAGEGPYTGADPATGRTFMDELSGVLEGAGANYSDLDPSGKKSDAEMREEVIASIPVGEIKAAQRLFRELQTAASGHVLPKPPESMWEEIHKRLKLAALFLDRELNYADLDPSGKKSAGEMHDELDLALLNAEAKEEEPGNVSGKVRSARSMFTKLSTGDIVTGAARTEDKIRLALKDVGLSALDPSGKKTASEIETELTTAVKNATAADALRENRSRGISLNRKDSSPTIR